MCLRSDLYALFWVCVCVCVCMCVCVCVVNTGQMLRLAVEGSPRKQGISRELLLQLPRGDLPIPGTRRRSNVPVVLLVALRLVEETEVHYQLSFSLGCCMIFFMPSFVGCVCSNHIHRTPTVERPRESFGDSSTQAGLSYSSQGPMTQPLLTQSLPLSQQSSLPFSQQSDRGYKPSRLNSSDMLCTPVSTFGGLWLI
jgi:hypothetical protein